MQLGTTADEASEAALAAYGDAYTVLTDAEERKKYDEGLRSKVRWLFSVK